MSNEPTTVEKLRGLPWSVGTNAANSIFSQFTFFGSVFVLFLNTLGMSKTAIGFVLALIPMSAIIAPVAAPATALYGYKRVFVWFYALRKAITALLLATPWALAAWGQQATLVYIALVVGLFAVVRAIEETAYIPWVQEFVPNSVRGKYSAASNIFTALTGFTAVWVAGVVLDVYDEGLTGFMVLFAAGVAAGVVSVWASAHIPGGAPQPEVARAERHLREAVYDRDLQKYSLGVALVTLGTVPLASFLPLFMEEEVGLASSDVVLLQMGTLLGALLSSYLWGWAADRYGSKPVMLVGALLLVVTPVLWWLTPRGNPLSLYAALSVAFVQGVANLGWGIGAGRLFYVRIVPVEKKLDYMAVYFAWIGVVTGVSQFLGGRALDMAGGISGAVWGMELNAYAPLFAVALLLPLLSVWMFRTIQGDSPVSTTEFASIFLRGNPFLAMGSLIRFYRAKDEQDAVLVTERMGEIGSRLTVGELLEALADPRFNVRFEAILAIARMPPDKQLTQALIQVVNGRSPALSVVAVWALGRIGDKAALEPLRTGLNSGYRSVRAYSARALGTLGDAEVAPELLARLQVEEDDDLGVAYASALGRMGALDAVQPLLTRLRDCPDDALRMELALALARLVGDERHYVQLARGMRTQPGTSAAQTLAAARRHLQRTHPRDPIDGAELLPIEDSFAHDQLDVAAVALGEWIGVLPWSWYRPEGREILREAGFRLTRYGARRREYLLLALHTLTTGLVD
jgi:MFS family permease